MFCTFTQKEGEMMKVEGLSVDSIVKTQKVENNTKTPSMENYIEKGNGNIENKQEQTGINIVKEEKKEISEEKLKKAIMQMNESIRIFDKRIHFDVHKDSGRIFVQVIDVENDKVIREIPPEEMLEISAKIHEMVGLLIDEKR
jgi:flagellar protein FlaG